MKRRKCTNCNGKGCFEYETTYHRWLTNVLAIKKKYHPCLVCEGRGWIPEEPQSEQEVSHAS